MRRIHPDEEDDPDLVRAYAYPEGRPWLRLNMVASADGAAWDQGLSGGLSGKADKRVFGVLLTLSRTGLVSMLVGTTTMLAVGLVSGRLHLPSRFVKLYICKPLCGAVRKPAGTAAAAQTANSPDLYDVLRGCGEAKGGEACHKMCYDMQ